MGKPVYDEIGKNYNKTRQADPFLAAQLFDLLAPEKDECYLDVGCGTGNYSGTLIERGISITGLDPSQEMLAKARRRFPDMKWVEGRAEELPFEADQFAGALATLTLHHWKSLGKGFLEVARVIRPGGKFVVFTSTRQQMNGYWLNHYFPKMLADSIDQMPALNQILAAAEGAGFELSQKVPYSIHPELKDCFLYVGKDQPELYFNAEIRKGISSFSRLANREEVVKGLAELESDLESGKWSQIRQEYENEGGDYLFLCFENA